MNFVISLTTGFGQILMNIDKVKELEDNLSDLENIRKIVENSSLMTGVLTTPMPGFEDIYRRTPDGLVQLSWYPDTGVETIALVLFAYGPKGATSDQIYLSSGVKGGPSLYFSQPDYKNYFTKLSEKVYGLTFQGRSWVQNDILPKRKQLALTQAKKETPSLETE